MGGAGSGGRGGGAGNGIGGAGGFAGGAAGSSGMSGAGGMGGMPSLDCGDGVLQETEACDDGNRDPGDGCSPDCTMIEASYRCPTAEKKTSSRSAPPNRSVSSSSVPSAWSRPR